MKIPDCFSLKGKNALVTGSRAGLGAGMAIGLAQAGANVVVNGSTGEGIEEVCEAVRALGGKAVAAVADVADAQACADLVDLTVRELGSIDILINNAGIIRRSPAVDYPAEDWTEVLEVNLNAVFRLCQLAGRRMLAQGSGKIVNVSSLLAFQGGILVPAYAASKGAVAQLTKALANEWASKGINVNAIAPGYMATDNTRALRADPVRSRAILERIPAGRWGTPEDLAGTAVFLASPASDYMHGHVLVVDGGWDGTVKDGKVKDGKVKDGKVKIKAKEGCRFELVALGEIMLRFDPGDRRVATARSFDVYEGGGEYNVARGLKRCFGMDTAVVTAFADNPVGRLLQDLIYQGGVDQKYVRWVEYDGVGRAVRNGLNFTERGFGVRGAVGCSDRGHTAASQLKAGEIDWDEVFGRDGARWFHTGGIFCALSESTPGVALEAMEAAHRHGTIVSYDLNYRGSLWKAVGGKKRAQEVNRQLAPLVDVMIGNEEDFSAALGFEIPGMDENLTRLETAGFERMIEAVVKEFPFSVVATTLRKATTASRNDWGAMCWCDGKFHAATHRPGLEIYDRVGGGDGFASGLIYGFLSGQTAQWAVECGAAHGALAMTTPGDTTMATVGEVLQLMQGKSARIVR